MLKLLTHFKDENVKEEPRASFDRKQKKTSSIHFPVVQASLIQSRFVLDLTNLFFSNYVFQYRVFLFLRAPFVYRLFEKLYFLSRGGRFAETKRIKSFPPSVGKRERNGVNPIGFLCFQNSNFDSSLWHFHKPMAAFKQQQAAEETQETT